MKKEAFVWVVEYTEKGKTWRPWSTHLSRAPAAFRMRDDRMHYADDKLEFRLIKYAPATKDSK